MVILTLIIQLSYLFFFSLEARSLLFSVSPKMSAFAFATGLKRQHVFKFLPQKDRRVRHQDPRPGPLTLHAVFFDSTPAHDGGMFLNIKKKELEEDQPKSA